MKEIKPVKDIGFCGVDSGQILIVDPKLFSENWSEEEFQDERKYIHKETGDRLNYQEHFASFAAILEPYGKDMNAMIKAEEVMLLPRTPAKEVLSYNSCCLATLESAFGILGDGIAVATRTGVGDGSYHVFPLETKDGVQKGVQIVFLEEFDITKALTDCEGEIKCESGMIMFADPCYSRSQENLTPEAIALKMNATRGKGAAQLNYDKGHEGLGVLVEAEIGNYDVYIHKEEYIPEGDSWGERVFGVVLVKSED